jgi:Ca-activated chloride channel family protein
MYLAAKDQEKRAQYPRKAMVVISDGGDNRSRYTEKELHKFLGETDVQVYVIGLYNPFSCIRRSDVGRLRLTNWRVLQGVICTPPWIAMA